MIALAFSSLWHWQQREDCDNEKLSISYWQISRVYSLINEGLNAVKYGKLCLEFSENKTVSAFYLGYAFEALARAESVLENKDKVKEYLIKATDICNKLNDEDEQQYLQEDLETIH